MFSRKRPYFRRGPHLMGEDVEDTTKNAYMQVILPFKNLHISKKSCTFALKNINSPKRIGNALVASRERIGVITYHTHTYNILCILSCEVEFLYAKKHLMNTKIHPVLYHLYLRLKDTLAAEIVHRRKRTSNMSIEVIFYCDQKLIKTGRMNTLPEAERWGFWIICRPQTKINYMFYKEHRVYQLYLSPVHPKKRREMQHVIHSLSDFAETVAA